MVPDGGASGITIAGNVTRITRGARPALTEFSEHAALSATTMVLQLIVPKFGTHPGTFS